MSRGAPYAVGLVVFGTFVLLFLMTGSVVIPVKALLLNVISLGAALGVVVWIFQDGNLEGPLNFTSVGAVESMVPFLVLAFGFGLSMDYEVFLLSRITEEYRAGAQSDRAVSLGLQRTGRIITVFGCGGDRDRTKRPKMGRIAVRFSDIVVLTSDNPRTEDPAGILAEVEAGVKEALKERPEVDYALVADRRLAIERAIREARTGDMVLIAGKGHEDYQIIGTTKVHFDDREIAREAIHNRGLSV